MMDSSFLTLVNVSLGIFATYSLAKVIIRFGWPNHPARLTIYLVSICAAAFFVMKAMVGLGQLSPFLWLKWKTLPLVMGSLALLLQVITTVGTISRIQQNVISRLPLIAGLLCFAFFPQFAEYLFAIVVLAGMGFLSVSVGKARHQKRLFFKMAIFLGLFQVFRLFNEYWLFVVGESLLLVALFYFSLFEESLGLKTYLEELSFDEGKAV